MFIITTLRNLNSRERSQVQVFAWFRALKNFFFTKQLFFTDERLSETWQRTFLKSAESEIFSDIEWSKTWQKEENKLFDVCLVRVSYLVSAGGKKKKNSGDWWPPWNRSRTLSWNCTDDLAQHSMCSTYVLTDYWPTLSLRLYHS